MEAKDSYELVKVKDLALGQRIKWNARSRAGAKPGIIHLLKPVDGGLIHVGTSIGDRRLEPDDMVIRLVASG